MPDVPAPAADRLTQKGTALLRTGGLSLVGLGFGLAVALDPWTRTGGAWRWVQGLSFAAGLLLLTVLHLLASGPKADLRRLLPALLGGIAVALGGAALSAFSREMALLAAAGAGLQAWGVGSLLARCAGRRVRVLLAVLLCGLLLDVGAALAAGGQLPALETWLGPDTGLRLRLLRLARAASGTLPLLSLLSEGLAVAGCRWSALGRGALVFGAVTMPACLVAAAVEPRLKYLLPLPADALALGVGVAAVAAWKGARRGEGVGWTLVLGSMAAGLLMGLYSFDGPLRPPVLLGGYDAAPRSLLRLAHSYSVVLGLALIVAARGSRGPDNPGPEPAEDGQKAAITARAI